MAHASEKLLLLKTEKLNWPAIDKAIRAGGSLLISSNKPRSCRFSQQDKIPSGNLGTLSASEVVRRCGYFPGDWLLIQDGRQASEHDGNAGKVSERG
jgi:hypothetical protein